MKKFLAPIFFLTLLIFTVFVFTGCGTTMKTVTDRNRAQNLTPDQDPEPSVVDYLELKIRLVGNDSFILPIHIGTTNNLQIVWGDGSEQLYTDTPTNKQAVSHNYIEEGEYTIRIKGYTYFAGLYNQSNGGRLGFGFGNSGSGYDTGTNKNKVISVSGSLTKLLYDGEDAKTDNDYLFFNSFYGCMNLKSISPELFAGKELVPAKSIFQNTFYDCSSLTGNIPAKLFEEINGTPARDMFNSTFYQCSSLTGIGEDLFGKFDDLSVMNMFSGTFYGCTNLTGESATLVNSEGDTVKIYIAFPYEGNYCYYGNTKLSDYNEIPIMWGGGI